MREELSAALRPLAADPRTVFITGDLGYHLFDDLAASLGDRFINAGVAEQNMIGVAAGLAREGLRPWVYSIAPFVFARPFEQIRNDVCLHNLPVRLLGNGAGLSYGTLGPTHHGAEDYAVMLVLPNMSVFTPAFDQDVPAVIEAADALPGPCYVRLGRGELPEGAEPVPFARWRLLLSGDGPVVLTTSTIAGSVWGAVADLPDGQRPDLWLVSELPLGPLPEQLVDRLAAGAELVIVEEHTRQGGLASMAALALATQRIAVSGLTSLGLDSVQVGGYGSHRYLRQLAGLDPDSVRAAVLDAGRTR